MFFSGKTIDEQRKGNCNSSNNGIKKKQEKIREKRRK